MEEPELNFFFFFASYFCSGGLTNHIYICSLPKSLKPRSNCQEPSKVLLRLYGVNYGANQISKADLSNLVLDNVIFTILSERRLGPKLYGKRYVICQRHWVFLHCQCPRHFLVTTGKKALSIIFSFFLSFSPSVFLSLFLLFISVFLSFSFVLSFFLFFLFIYLFLPFCLFGCLFCSLY